MDYLTDPMGIERKSMDIISAYIKELNLTDQETKIYSRIIHAAGDPDYAQHICIHPEFISAARGAICSGKGIITDVHMVETGINKKRLADFGGKIYCAVADADVAETAKTQGITRSMAAINKLSAYIQDGIVAIGNAPTALVQVLRLVEQGIRPAAIVGVPVGFVGAAESKEELFEQLEIPFITVRGTKGGSTIAAAIVNALLYLEDER